MTEIKKINSGQEIQKLQPSQNQSSVQTFNQAQNQPVKDTVVVNTFDNSKIVPPVGNENPFLQNPFYQAQQLGAIPQTQYNYPFINQANYTENTSNNLWKYLVVGGLGLFTGLALGSLMSYSYYMYYPMYYSYLYSPCWYNFGWNYWWW